MSGRIRSTLGNDLDLDIVDNEDGTFNLYYTPHNPGNYVIKVKFGGQDIPGGDFVVTVSDPIKPHPILSLLLFPRRPLLID